MCDKIDRPKISWVNNFLQTESYLTLATAHLAEHGRLIPHINQVFFAMHRSFIGWRSLPTTQHSRNLTEYGLVAATLAQYQAPQGTGLGIYIKGKARQLDKSPKSQDNQLAWEIAQALQQKAAMVNRTTPHPPTIHTDHLMTVSSEGIWVIDTNQANIKCNGAIETLTPQGHKVETDIKQTIIFRDGICTGYGEIIYPPVP